MTQHRGTELPLPVFDVSTLDSGSASESTESTRVLVDQLQHTGCVYLVGHGVPTETIHRAFEVSKRFFALSHQVRMSVADLNSPHFRGFVPSRGEHTKGPTDADRREQFVIGPETAPQPLAPEAPWRQLIGPNQWPDALPELRPVMLDWLGELTTLSHRLLSAIATALHGRPDFFDGLVAGNPNHRLRTSHYPAGTAGFDDNGLGAHRDHGLLALIAQDDAGGLQMEDGHDGWVDVTPLPGALVVNLGETLHVATGGRLPAPVHRVITPPTGVERYSFAFAFNPHIEALTKDTTAPQGAATTEHYGRRVLARWLQSSPHIARRHFPDVDPGALLTS
ncbi:isopenicillin N synthase family dioxygenase [Streptomyces sp. ME19-01-6]|uniref:isopenicillin N synthase family dioxygenase n=1 Tax=Streptomyces sp. ME19-01-6 TaxID=3028686 RepID=UPI0029B5B24E|nr:2-oxoglutarate and iron-dependent oxygenase domain-containing protein [Streptomyces sp. ME19-01-6]MDX3227404.1 2-oxoglutarate and iron-dependent oxygenase domain-containing protein [Streptomyces sp. ME19-01-6]